MNKTDDDKLYNNYLNGDNKEIEILYNKYKNKIRYFIFNIVKDYQIAEDLTQDTFMYVIQNKMKEGYSFKFYIYLVAKSKAINYINKEKRRNEITKTYLENTNNQIEKDIEEIITENEDKEKLIEAIELLDEKYKNAIYLTKIEGLSYKETADILGETLPNIKNLVHRGKKQLRKILEKEGGREMKKSFKMAIIILCIFIAISGISYATYNIIKTKGKAKMTPNFTSKISTIDSNKVWVGTFNLIWNDFMDDVVKGKVEFEDGESALAEELNKQEFTVNQLSENSYFKIQGKSSYKLKEEIEKEIKQRFNEESKILDNIEWNNPYGYILYAMLKKEFNFLEKFPSLNDGNFKNSEEKVKYFGIEPDTDQTASKNVEILFYNSKDDFAVKLKTKEGEEVYLYRTTGEDKSFKENYDVMIKNGENYTGNKKLDKSDTLKIPYIKVNDEINYDELCGKVIKGTEGLYIEQALQTIDFELNNYGGSIKSEALMETLQDIIFNTKSTNRNFSFDNDFILYLKESNKQKPYFALKVDNTDVLVDSEL